MFSEAPLYPMTRRDRRGSPQTHCAAPLHRPESSIHPRRARCELYFPRTGAATTFPSPHAAPGGDSARSLSRKVTRSREAGMSPGLHAQPGREADPGKGFRPGPHRGLMEERMRGAFCATSSFVVGAVLSCVEC